MFTGTRIVKEHQRLSDTARVRFKPGIGDLDWTEIILACEGFAVIDESLHRSNRVVANDLKRCA